MESAPRFTAPAGAFGKPAAELYRVIRPKPKTLAPILEHHILITATADRGIMLVRHGLTESAAITISDADVDVPGCITVGAAQLVGWLHTLPPATTVTLAGNALSANGSACRLDHLPADGFPAMLAPANGSAFELADSMLLARGAPFASTEPTRYYLNGGMLAQNGKHLTAVFADGHRLFVTKLPLPAGAERLPADVIIPNSAIATIARMKGPITARIDDRIASFMNGELEFATTLIAAKHVDWIRIIPAKSPNTIEVTCADLLPALRRLTAIGDGEPAATVGLTWAAGGALELTLPRCGTAFETLAAATCSATGCVAVNAEYLTEIITALDAEHVMLDVSAPNVLVRITSPNDADMLALVTPMLWPE